MNAALPVVLPSFRRPRRGPRGAPRAAGGSARGPLVATLVACGLMAAAAAAGLRTRPSPSGSARAARGTSWRCSTRSTRSCCVICVYIGASLLVHAEPPARRRSATPTSTSTPPTGPRSRCSCRRTTRSRSSAGILTALLDVDYPPGRLHILPIDDRSTRPHRRDRGRVRGPPPGRGRRPSTARKGEPGKAAALRDAMALVTHRHRAGLRRRLHPGARPDQAAGGAVLRPRGRRGHGPRRAAQRRAEPADAAARPRAHRRLPGGPAGAHEPRAGAAVRRHRGRRAARARWRASAAGASTRWPRTPTPPSACCAAAGRPSTRTARSATSRCRPPGRSACGRCGAGRAGTTRRSGRTPGTCWPGRRTRFREKLDGWLLLNVYLMSPILLLGWLLAMALWYLGENAARADRHPDRDLVQRRSATSPSSSR